jgi:hypothetical protein
MTTKTQQKQFDVTYVSPFNGREVTSREVPANSIYQNDSGEMVYRYNNFYPACEVITACEVPQSRLDAQLAYFTKYGTANE